MYDINIIIIRLYNPAVYTCGYYVIQLDDLWKICHER